MRYDKRPSAHHTNVGRVSSRPPHLAPPVRSSVSAPKATPCAASQSTIQPVNQVNQLAGCTASPSPCRQPSSRRMPTQWVPSVSMPVPPRPSRSQAAAGFFPIRYPISTAAHRARRPRESKSRGTDAVDEYGRTQPSIPDVKARRRGQTSRVSALAQDQDQDQDRGHESLGTSGTWYSSGHTSSGLI